MSRDRVIVDGYNLLHAHPVYASRVKADLDGARAHLVADLAGYATGGPRTIVVFDGGGNPASDGTPHHLGQLTVIFSPAGTSADTVVEGLAARFRERGEGALVVTSDVATRETVRSGSVSVLSSDAFAADLVEEASERAGEGRRDGTRVSVSQRIAPEVRGVLLRWAQGSAPGGIVKD